MAKNTQIAKSNNKLTEKEINTLIDANKGDKEAAAKISKILRDQPIAMQTFGDQALRAKIALINSHVGNTARTSQTAMEYKMEQIQNEVAGPYATPTEKLLAENVAICWLHTYILETKSCSGGELKLLEYYHKALTKAQRRYMLAIKTLAIVKRLAIPVLKQQVYIAEQQVVNNTRNKQAPSPKIGRPHKTDTFCEPR